MDTPNPFSLRFGIFIGGQIVMTLGALALLFDSMPQAWAFAAVVLGASLLVYGAPGLNARARAAFPLSLRISLFIIAMLLLAGAFLIRRVY